VSAGGTNATVRDLIGEIIDNARAETGLDDFGRDSWREGLEVLVTSAEAEGTFNDYGRGAFYASLVRPLINRLHVEDWYRRHPEIDDQELLVEMLGVGFPRTGSTALSHLLAEDHAFRNLLIWEQSEPCPPPGVSTDADEARIAAQRAMLDISKEHVAARLHSMLPHSATGPMEDHDMMAPEFKAQSFLVAAHIPSYAEWFLHCDMEPTYRYEKRVLKLLQWQTPQKVWRLKSPTHTLFLETYEKVFPDARFVQTHREVSKVLPSVSDLYYTMLQAGNDVDPLYVGELNMHQWSIAMDRMLAFRTDPARNAKFFDIGFTHFQSEPIAEIRRLYRWLGDDLRDETVECMLAWRADNPADKHGRHEYGAEQFGITPDALAKRFGAYRTRFGPLL
jgi:hypothetical protein